MSARAWVLFGTNAVTAVLLALAIRANLRWAAYKRP